MARSLRKASQISMFGRSILAAAILWQVLAWIVGQDYLIPPVQHIVKEGWRLLVSGEVLSALGVSLQRLMPAYFSAAMIGTALGLLMGMNRTAAALLEWTVELARPISGIALIPLFLVVFGISELVPMSIIFYASVFPFILNTYSGVRNVDDKLIRAATVLGASRKRVVWRVLIPASLPHIVTGARIAGGVAWMAIIVAELVGAPNGIGYSVGFAQQLGKASLVMAWVGYIGLFGYVLDRVLLGLERKVAPWTQA